MLYKCRGKILLNNYFCKGWKIKPILFFLVLLNTYIFTKCVHLVLCGYTTEFSLRWDPLTENPYKNRIKVGFNQLCGAQKSEEKQESLEDIHSSNAAESPLPRQAMFWEMYTHTCFLGQSRATRHSWSRDLRLLNPAVQGQFFHFSFYISEGNQSGASILTLNSAPQELEERPFILSAPAFGRTCRQLQPGNAPTAFAPLNHRGVTRGRLLQPPCLVLCGTNSSGRNLKALSKIHCSKRVG